MSSPASNSPKTTLLTPEQRAAFLRVRTLLKEEGKGGDGWNDAWQEGTTPWDAGEIQPPLKEFFQSAAGQELLGTTSESEGGALKALVPGCGRGYDAAYLASLGYDTIGADLSQKAIEAARTWLANQSNPPPNVKYEVIDFFNSEVTDGGYDLVYDYTFFCALPPTLRPDWAKRMSALVKPRGHLIALAFPIDSSRPRDDGPPFPVDVEAYEAVLGAAGEWKKVADIVPETSINTHVGRERVLVFQRA